MKRRLYKSTTDKKLAGVCAGFAAYLNLDVSLIRILFFAVTLFTVGLPGVIVYIVCAAVLPTDEEVFAQQSNNPYGSQYNPNGQYNPNSQYNPNTQYNPNSQYSPNQAPDYNSNNNQSYTAPEQSDNQNQ